LAYNSDGFGIWSKIPLTGSFWLAPGHPEFSGVLHPKDQPEVSLLVVHTDAPVTSLEAQYWSADQKVIAQKIQGLPHPVVVVGDFNATMAMRAFRPVLGAGVQDAGTATGEGWQMTWPADHPNLPQLVRIDHLLYSPGLTVTSYRLGVSAGSDHRPLLVTVAPAIAPGRHQ
jgi:endonuclease/exonuclease/phosphatase (EEP) superfamily protein YafD